MFWCISEHYIRLLFVCIHALVAVQWDMFVSADGCPSTRKQCFANISVKSWRIVLKMKYGVYPHCMYPIAQAEWKRSGWNVQGVLCKNELCKCGRSGLNRMDRGLTAGSNRLVFCTWGFFGVANSDRIRIWHRSEPLCSDSLDRAGEVTTKRPN